MRELCVHALSGSPKVFSTFSKKMSNVCIWDVPFMTAMVLFAAQTCAVPLRMKESAYRTFILLSAKASACIVTAIWTALTNSSVLSWFPSNGSGLAALALRTGLCKDWTGLGVHDDSLCHCGCCSQSHIGDVITRVCYLALEESIRDRKSVV